MIAATNHPYRIARVCCSPSAPRLSKAGLSDSSPGRPATINHKEQRSTDTALGLRFMCRSTSALGRTGGLVARLGCSQRGSFRSSLRGYDLLLNSAGALNGSGPFFLLGRQPRRQALYRLEQRYGLSPNQITHLRSRRAKSCDVSLFARLRAAYLDLCERQVSKLQHEIAIREGKRR